jgi:hypothetical protein
LIRLQYKIIYRKGSENRLADALSQHPAPTDQLLALSFVTPIWLAKVQEGYNEDVKAKQIIATLAVSSQSIPHFTLSNGLFRYKGRIWIGTNVEMQHQILEAMHSSTIGGHFGFPATYIKLKQLFAWIGMKAATKSFVASCSICQQAKLIRVKYLGLLSPLPAPSCAWQTVSLDFIEGLPRSDSANCILVIVDTFSKYSHFLLMLHPFTVTSVAQVFLNQVYRLHGMPSAIISDKDRIFTSKFWHELFRLAGVSLQMSSAYHPQIDGQTERVNQCLETFLHYFVHTCPKQCSKWLPLAEYWYNTSLYSVLNQSPFEVLYGYPPRHFGIQPIDSYQVQDLASWLQEREFMTDVIRQHLLRAQKRMKQQGDKNGSEITYEVGDKVYLKLQPYVQASLSPRAHQKLVFKFFGPFKISEKISEVAYKLELPSSSSIHLVFHASQLKRAVSPVVIICPQLIDSVDMHQVPELILDSRMGRRGDAKLAQVLVKWSHMDVALATWEDTEALCQCFPAAPAWGQAGFPAPGDVSTLADAEKAPRPKHARKLNIRMIGPERAMWVCELGWSSELCDNML